MRWEKESGKRPNFQHPGAMMNDQHNRSREATGFEPQAPGVGAMRRLLDGGREAIEEWLLWLAIQVTYRTRWGDGDSLSARSGRR